MRLRHSGRDAGDLVMRLVPDTEENKPIPDPPPVVPVPTRLPSRPHPAVVATREVAKSSRYDWIDTRRHTGIAHLAVSKSNLRRALLILQGVFAEAERRGYPVAEFFRSYSNCRGGVGLRIRGEVHEVVVLEERRRLSAEEIEERGVRYQFGTQHNLEPTGRLRLALGHDGFGPPLATDRQRWRIEDRLGHAFNRIEAHAAETEERRLRLEAEEVAREARRQREHEAAAAAEAQRERMDHLVDQVQAWRLAADIRDFVDSASAVLDGAPATGEWLHWAADMADRVDPIRSGTLGPPPMP
jgi:hypothetical protein